MMTTFLESRKRAKAAQAESGVQAPKPGDEAPEFCLHDVDGENPICLSDFRGQKPVALVLGSFT